MNLLKSLVFISIAAGLAACSGSSGSNSGTSPVVFDSSQLKGAWQAVALTVPQQDGKTILQTMADDKGFLNTSHPAGGKATDKLADDDIQAFFTFDGAKFKSVAITRNAKSVTEDTEDYTVVNNNTIKTKNKDADGKLEDRTYTITRLVKGSLVMRDDQGDVVMCKRVTDADVQNARNAAAGVANPAASPAPGVSPSPADVSAQTQSAPASGAAPSAPATTTPSAK